ncbi:MAG: HAD-IA family hydrolase [Paludibacteraceae bacterium]|nr:HAD-IA family hydrolase [Paludibacteraceae bacterium]
MSDDYLIAIDCGATSVRIGSAIFGKRRSRSFKAFFFDMDGTLFDSMPVHAVAWEETMKRHGLDFDAEATYINEGRTGEDVIREAFEMKGEQGDPQTVAAIYREKTEAFRRMCPEGAAPVPGATELLEWLHEQGVECWIVTGSGQKSLLEHVNRVFPGIFTRERMITAFDVTHGKPSPEPYLKAWERSGYSKHECCVIENAPLGVRSGKAADLFTIAVNTGPLDDSLLYAEHADRVFPSMPELLRWLQSLNAKN